MTNNQKDEISRRAINQARIDRRARAIAEAADEFENAVKSGNAEDVRAWQTADELMILAEDMTLKALKAVKGKPAKDLIAASAAARFMACKLEWLASEYMDADVELVHQVESYLWQSIDIAVRVEQEDK